ncbi:MAG TPA: sulfotransferase [Mycobacteriales bacterium]|nr:sulfotransferase [Mycobacteriales bacterium]
MTLLDRLDRLRPWHVFDRPVFVIAAPRSGSTLLFQLLDAHPDLVSWPGEAHPAFDAAQPPDHPWELGHQWPAAYATEQRRRDLARELYLGRLRARKAAGLPVGRVERLGLGQVRLLEKTPANVVRVAALAPMFPTARFVYLHRDAPATIGSLIESWERPSRAHVQGSVQGREIRWMMLAAPGWFELMDEPAPVKSAFQWRAGVQIALDDLATVDPSRVVTLSYEDLVADPQTQLRRVLDHCELSHAPEVLAAASVVGTPGRTSLSAPRADKWRERAADIEPLLPPLRDLRRRLGYDA